MKLVKLVKRKRLSLSITRLGIQFVVATLLMGGFAVNTGNNLLYLLFSILLGFFLVSGWVSRKAIQDLDLVAVEEGDLFARMRGTIRVRLQDRAPGRARGLEIGLRMERVQVEPGFFPGGGKGLREPSLLLHAHPERRGSCRLASLELRTAFPFGLMEKAWRFELDQDVLVLPHPRSHTASLGWDAERRFSRPRAGSASPDGARPFRERDPLSSVHWKRTAQRGAPWVRTFEDEEPSGLQLRLNLREWRPGAAFERELEILSGGILQARLHKRQVLLTVLGPGGSRDYEGFTPCWQALALAQASGHFAAEALP